SRPPLTTIRLFRGAHAATNRVQSSSLPTICCATVQRIMTPVTVRAERIARRGECGLRHPVVAGDGLGGARRARGTMAGMQQESVRVVVAAVIERDGQILAARRTGPPDLAGKWEFPGGKVEPGEEDIAALIRECEEEIGVRIRVGERIGPEYAIAGGSMVVRTFLAAIEEGEPALRGSHTTCSGCGRGRPRPARCRGWRAIC